MIDRKWIGHELGASVLPIERSRLQFFATAIGEPRGCNRSRQERRREAEAHERECPITDEGSSAGNHAAIPICKCQSAIRNLNSEL